MAMAKTPTTVGANRSSSYRERNSTADRTLDILALFARGRVRITGAELAAELGVARSTTYRYLQTLTSSGFIEEDPDGGFRLGMRIFELARVARASYGLSEVAVPIMHELAAATWEVAVLTRRSRDRVVCLEHIEETVQPVRFSYERGSVFPLNAGAAAWPLIAWESDDTIRRLLDGTVFEPITERTITDHDEILDRLHAVRAQGYAVTRGELDPYAVGIGAPIFDENERVVACVSVVGLSHRIGDDIDAQIAQVIDAAARISTKLIDVSQ
jgi:DNA-binding IclR family transcriptional regulator